MQPANAVFVGPDQIVGRLLVLVITDHHSGSGKADLALGVVGQFLRRVGIGDHAVDEGHGIADAVEQRAVISRQRCRRDEFGHTQAFEQRAGRAEFTENFIDSRFILRRHRLAAVDRPAQEGQIHSLGLLDAEQRFPVRRNGGDVVGLVLFGVLIELFGFIFGHQNTGDAERDGLQHRRTEAVVDKRRQYGKLRLSAPDIQRVTDLNKHRIEVGVGAHAALRTAGGAAGVRDDRSGRGILFHFGQRRIGACLNEVLPVNCEAVVRQIEFFIFQRIKTLDHEGHGFAGRNHHGALDLCLLEKVGEDLIGSVKEHHHLAADLVEIKDQIGMTG